jgi:acyl-CoA synthetase (AMP-forming)/AMP-acid ligase II
MRVADVVRRHAAARPHDTALVCGSERFTWKDLDERTDALAAVLAGISEPGGRIAIVTANCHRHLETVFAASKASLVSVPLNHRWTGRELTATIGDVEPAAVVLDLGLPKSVGLELIDRLAPTPVLAFGGRHAGAVDYDDALEDGRGRPAEHRDAWHQHVIGFTSGTTGRPRGAVLSQQQALAAATWLAALFTISAEDCFLACMPMYVYRGGSGVLAPALVGARSVVCDFDAGTVLGVIRDQEVTHAILAPVMVDRILASPHAAGGGLGSLREVWVGGAPSTPESIAALQRLTGATVGSVYGATEATAVASMRWPAEAEHGRLLGSIGRPAPLNDVRVAATSGREARPGEPGEIQVRGSTVMSGYWPDADGDGLVDGWYCTGDIAVRDDDGYLFLVDRRADVINSGGLNVYSVEVEQVLLTHPAVAECAVVSSPDDAMGEAVTAVVVSAGEPPDFAELERHCREGLASYKCPRQWVLAGRLPRNALGKIDKKAIRDERWGGRQASIAGSRTHGPGETGTISGANDD